MANPRSTETEKPKRQPGRPRVMSDDAIYTAGLAVLAEVGSERLTLARLASVLGVTPAAVRQRFGSKRGLLVEMSRRRVEQTEHRFAAARAAFSSPLEALQAAFVAELDQIAEPRQLANMERHIGELLAEATERDEIAGPVTPELVSTVLAAVEGTMLIWAIAPRGDIKARIHEAVQVALGLGGR